jgi:FkbM family methyltransferase
MSSSRKFALKRLVRKVVNAAGFDVHRLTPSSNPDLQLSKALSRFQVDLILDVGANVGQFALGMREVGYRGPIVSFEPLSTAHLKLSEAAARDGKWHVHSRVAIGEMDGVTQINIAENSVSSSLLPMTDAHRGAAAKSAYIAVESVPIRRLDSVAPEYMDKGRTVFLKIDAQGFEWQILDGASATLPFLRGILCELSLVPLYEGQRLWMDVIDRLEAAGFKLWSILKGFTDVRDGRTLQINAVFFRS